MAIPLASAVMALTILVEPGGEEVWLPQGRVLQGESQKGYLHISRAVALRFQVCPLSSGVGCSPDKEHY